VVAVVLTDVELLLADKHCRDVVLAAAQAVDSQDYDAFVALPAWCDQGVTRWWAARKFWLPTKPNPPAV
jgi:hypothetical protein